MSEDLSYTDMMMLLYLCKKERNLCLQRLEENEEEPIQEKASSIEIHLACIMSKLIAKFPEQARDKLYKAYKTTD